MKFGDITIRGIIISNDSECNSVQIIPAFQGDINNKHSNSGRNSNKSHYHIN